MPRTSSPLGHSWYSAASLVRPWSAYASKCNAKITVGFTTRLLWLDWRSENLNTSSGTRYIFALAAFAKCWRTKMSDRCRIISGSIGTLLSLDKPYVGITETVGALSIAVALLRRNFWRSYIVFKIGITTKADGALRADSWTRWQSRQ